eukprot:CAMPEP_0174716208 /NCGR_PEP_ID=MMETSP1094-20130205/23275_1 /TAXON_ID=156173 /ORGANISM="Chrysochromulina brevifilum, Strain UTEX LB 985" /LENGTH=56 /DNA_ID=CAMNT_0015915901 /DNA_START=182 /DNA_END=353 /DNA_ORIENTATION=+
MKQLLSSNPAANGGGAGIALVSPKAPQHLTDTTRGRHDTMHDTLDSLPRMLAPPNR